MKIQKMLVKIQINGILEGNDRDRHHFEGLPQIYKIFQRETDNTSVM